MGACFSSGGGETKPKAAPSKTPTRPFSVTVSFPNVAPYTMTVDPSDKVGVVRAACEKEMARRQDAGLDFVKIEGKIMTLNPDTGEGLSLADGSTIKSANLENKQYLWFHDQSENARVDELILRSSRLTENRSHNSRGAKAGMALVREENGVHAAEIRATPPWNQSGTCVTAAVPSS